MSDLNDREDGLFPESEPPKRENPYLRKNKPKPEKPPREPKPPKEPKVKPSAAPAADAPAEKATAYRNPRRGLRQFFSDHVKLITAVLTAALVLSLVVITDVYQLVPELIDRIEQGDKQPMTMGYVRALSEKNGPIVWRDFENIAMERKTDASGSLTWVFKVQGTSYEVWISGPGTSYTPTYVILVDMSDPDAPTLDLNKGDLDAFLNSTAP